jgi:hypothetical protein
MFSQKINKYTEETYHDLFGLLYNILLQWIFNRPEIIPLEEIDDFKIYFIEFLLVPKEQNNDYHEYYTLEYSDEIVDLFINLKEICSSRGTNFLHEKGRTSDDLSEFILKHAMINEKNESSILDEELDHDYEFTYF